MPRDESVWSDERLPVTDARRAEEGREPTEACDAASLTRFGVRFSMSSSASRMRTSSPPPARGENTGCASGENGIRAPAPALRPACVGVDGASCMAQSTPPPTLRPAAPPHAEEGWAAVGLGCGSRGGPVGAGGGMEVQPRPCCCAPAAGARGPPRLALGGGAAPPAGGQPRPAVAAGPWSGGDVPSAPGL